MFGLLVWVGTGYGYVLRVFTPWICGSVFQSHVSDKKVHGGVGGGREFVNIAIRTLQSIQDREPQRPKAVESWPNMASCPAHLDESSLAGVIVLQWPVSTAPALTVSTACPDGQYRLP